MNIEIIYEFCVALPDVKEEFPFGEDILVFKIHGKIFFLCFFGRNSIANKPQMSARFGIGTSGFVPKQSCGGLLYE